MNERAFLDTIETLPAGRYVAAVSGGVDSAVLLDVIAKNPDLEVVVAHVDHGIREDSADDARFVEGLAGKYNLPFFVKTLGLGANASEETARKHRYAFLRYVQSREGAAGIITAHHADDVLETAMLNMQRGTGWRGLASLRSGGEVFRPLLQIRKQEIIEYALANRLEFVQDATNLSDAYARNRIRQQIMPLVNVQPDVRATFDRLLRAQRELRDTIETEVQDLTKLLISESGLDLANLRHLPAEVATEVLRLFYSAHNVRQTRPQIIRALQFLAKATRSQSFSLDAQHFLYVTAEKLVVVTTKN